MGRQPRADGDEDAGVVPLAFRLAGLVRREFGLRMSGEAWAAEANLRPGCFGVLRAVAAADGELSQRELAAAMGIGASDVVDLLDRLEAAGYVRRDRDERDRRRNVLVLTPHGRAAMRRFEAVARAVDAAVLESLSDTERTTLRTLLERVVGTDESVGRTATSVASRGERASSEQEHGG